MKAYLLACGLIVALMPITSSAADLVYVWEQSTTREDGTQITGERGYSIKYSVNNSETVVGVGDVTSYTIAGVSEGVYTMQIATIESGLMGEYSSALTTVIAESEVSRPSTVTLTLQLECDGCGLEIKDFN